jgi:hypothetical protein
VASKHPPPDSVLEQAITSLPSHSRTSTKRLNALADYLKELFEYEGLPNVKGGSGGELQVPGLSRTKNWDLAYEFAGKFRLLLSLKSMLKNISGSVPNRLDDLQGEIANVQQLRPEIVIGYVVLFDMAEDSVRSEDSVKWSDYFEAALQRMAIRRAPLWNQGLMEGLWFIRFDSRKPPGRRLLFRRETAQVRQRFLQALLCELKLREPAVSLLKERKCTG